MEKKQKIKQDEMHQSMRGYFAGYLHNAMVDDEDIIVVTADLGYGVLDKIQENFPNRFYNVGASEQAAIGICVGLALEGKKPFFYSITTFGLYRPFETIRNYVDHEQIPVRFFLSGRDKDYAHDGFSHWSEDAWKFFFDSEYPNEKQNCLPVFQNIDAYWPNTKEEIPELVDKMVKLDKPQFISLRR